MDFIFGEKLWGACPSCDAERQHDTNSSVMCTQVTFCYYIFKEPGVNFTGCMLLAAIGAGREHQDHISNHY